MNDEELFNLLDWNSSREAQEEGIRIGLQRQNLEIFLQTYDKGIWENSARILAQKSDEELKKYIPKLLEWLQDINWPGAIIILNRLKKIDGKLLIKDFEMAIKKAREEEVNWIYSLSHLLENVSLKNMISMDCLNIIEKNNSEYY